MTQPDIGTDALFDVRPSSSLNDSACSVLASIPASQRARHQRLLRVVDRTDYVAARALALELVGRGTGVATDRIIFYQRCATCDGDDHGRPVVFIDGREVERVSASWSHSSGTVAAAVGFGLSVGIDVERTSELEPNVELLSILTEDERTSIAAAPNKSWAFRDLWVRKEALVKLGVVTLDEALCRPITSIVSANPTTSVMSWEIPACEAQVGLAVNSM